MDPPEEAPPALRPAACVDAAGGRTPRLREDPTHTQPGDEASQNEHEPQNWLSSGVVSVGAASFFSD
jgi:hypothetical protein